MKISFEQKLSRLSDLAVEFAMRSNDGIGIAENYPRMREVFEAFLDLFPERFTRMPDEDAAKLLGRTFEEAVKATPKAMEAMMPNGVAELIKSEIQGRSKKMILGDEGKELLDSLSEPEEKIAEKVTEIITTGFSVAIILGSYESARILDEKLSVAAARWHRQTGAAIAEGSTLHDHVGDGSGHEISRKEPTLLERAMRSNPFSEEAMSTRRTIDPEIDVDESPRP